MENLNLLERLQRRGNPSSFESSEEGSHDLHDAADESDSDIDDNITLDECEKFIDGRKEKQFTKVKTKTVENNNSASSGYKNTDGTNENIAISLNVNRSAVLQSEHVHPGSVLQNENVNPDSFPEPKPKKKKLTPEERKAIKEQKENEKLERQKKREELKLQKELEKERIKALKDRDKLAARSEKKEECMDRILAIVDPCLIEEAGGGDILKDLQDISVRYELKALPIPCCIGWMRESVEYKVDSNRKVNKSVSYTEEVNIIHKMSAFELATRIEAQKSVNDSEDTFLGLVKCLKDDFPLKKITIVVVGANAYHRLVKTKQNEDFRNKALGGGEQPVKRKKKELLVPTLTKEEFDNELIKIQITTNISVRFCEDMSDVSKLVSSFTKAMAEAPFKKAASSSLQFSTMLTTNKELFTISKDGQNIPQVWNQQLQQFYGVRNDTSTAISQLYPTPLTLLKAYQNCSKSEGEKLLQDVQVRRGVGVLQTQRRVGPELSKKIYKLCTSLDGNDTLGK